MDLILESWERSFRLAAEADDYTRLRAHLERLGLPDEPELLLEGTIRAVRMLAAYASMDGLREGFAQFVEMQTYDPVQSADARFVFTFDLYGKAYARVLVDSKIAVLDLADLYGMAWIDYQIVGFYQFWISRPDWTDLTDAERQQLEDEVTNDLLFDYGADEIAFWFDGDSDEAYLAVTVQDVDVDVDA